MSTLAARHLVYKFQFDDGRRLSYWNAASLMSWVHVVFGDDELLDGTVTRDDLVFVFAFSFSSDFTCDCAMCNTCRDREPPIAVTLDELVRLVDVIIASYREE